MGKFKRSIVLLIAIAVIASVLSTQILPVSATSGYIPSIGIWFNTAYAKVGNYIWIDGHGTGSQNQFLADVNGDGKADAIVYFASSGSWYVALSNGNGFGAYSQWITGHGVGSDKQLMADVNGDGKADAVVFFANTGSWYVALSNGSGFNSYTLWKSGSGTNSSNQFLGDVNGDGKADAVSFFSTGTWDVSLSNGSSFGTCTQWVAGHGSGSSKQLLGDVNGDGKDDAVVFFSSSGSWYVSLSSGSGFNAYSQWITGHGTNSTNQMLADVNGDGKKDAVYFTNAGSTGADWYWARSSGSNSFIMSEVWKMRDGYGCTNELVGDVFGDGTDAPVAYLGSTGTWKVLPADLYYVYPNIYNTWQSGFYNTNTQIKFLPRTEGVYQTYDSGDPNVIDDQLSMISSAGIDFLIIDLTNYIYADNGYINDRALEVASRINTWNSNPNNRPLKYAIAIGYMQVTHDPATMEQECGDVYNDYVNTSNGGTKNYYYLNGKPLIISYAEYNDRITWQNYTGDKTNSNNFTVRWTQGTVSTSNQNPPSSDYGLYYGWSYPNGSLNNSDTMVAMPGINNHKGVFVSRSYNGVNGGFYDQLCLQRILSEKPQTVVINSFNDFSEETGIQPSDTEYLDSTSEKWYNTNGQLDPDMYWNMTVNFISQLRQ